MTCLFLSLILLLAAYFTRSQTIFSMQETLNVLCTQFPLVSNVNDTSLLCARLRANTIIPPTAFDLDRPTQLSLFVIIDQPSSNLSSVDITIDFNQSSESPSTITEIFLSLLVTNSSFTINNDTTTSYSSYNIPTFRWQNSTTNTYELIDLLQLGNNEYISEASLCTWNLDRWNHLINGNSSNYVPYVYVMNTKDTQLAFTLIDTSTKVSLPPPPSPYLRILYCVPYKLGVVQIVLISFCCVLFVVLIIVLCSLHYFRGNDRNQIPHLERQHLRKSYDRNIRNHAKTGQRDNSSTSSLDQEDEKSNKKA